MFPILLFLFIAVPVIEIALFIQVGGVLGVWPTIALVLLTAIVGASLVRSQGLQTLLTVQQRLAQGQLPAQQILEGVMLAVAGVFTDPRLFHGHPRYAGTAACAACLFRKAVDESCGGRQYPRQWSRF